MNRQYFKGRNICKISEKILYRKTNYLSWLARVMIFLIPTNDLKYSNRDGSIKDAEREQYMLNMKSN